MPWSRAARRRPRLQVEGQAHLQDHRRVRPGRARGAPRPRHAQNDQPFYTTKDGVRWRDVREGSGGGGAPPKPPNIGSCGWASARRTTCRATSPVFSLGYGEDDDTERDVLQAVVGAKQLIPALDSALVGHAQGRFSEPVRDARERVEKINASCSAATNGASNAGDMRRRAVWTSWARPSSRWPRSWTTTRASRTWSCRSRGTSARSGDWRGASTRGLGGGRGRRRLGKAAPRSPAAPRPLRRPSESTPPASTTTTAKVLDREGPLVLERRDRLLMFLVDRRDGPPRGGSRPAPE